MNDLFSDSLRQLRKLSIYKPMQKFQVTQIKFDFSDAFDDPLTDEYKQSVVDETIEGVWEVHDEKDLLDEISACTGWCIKSIDYRNTLTGAIGGWA